MFIPVEMYFFCLLVGFRCAFPSLVNTVLSCKRLFGWVGGDVLSGLFFSLVPALLLSMFAPRLLPSSPFSLSGCLSAVPMRGCLGGTRA